MTWLDGFKADLLKVVQQRKPQAVAVTDWEEDERSGGFCETCSYNETVVEVTFRCDKCDEKGHLMSYKDHTWVWSGGLAELMRMLVDE